MVKCTSIDIIPIASMSVLSSSWLSIFIIPINALIIMAVVITLSVSECQRRVPYKWLSPEALLW